jgi:hypothetical protein
VVRECAGPAGDAVSGGGGTVSLPLLPAPSCSILALIDSVLARGGLCCVLVLPAGVEKTRRGVCEVGKERRTQESVRGTAASSVRSFARGVCTRPVRSRAECVSLSAAGLR